VWRIVPLAESSTGPVKISPPGMFLWPSSLIQVRPATEKVRSVSGPTRWISRLPARRSISASCRAPSSRQTATGSGRSTRPRTEDKIGQLAGRHLPVLGVGVGRIHGDAPAQATIGIARHHRLAQFAARALGLRRSRRIDARERLGVAVAHDRELRVEVFEVVARDRRDSGQLRLVGGAVVKRFEAGQAQVDVRVRSEDERLPEALLDQRRGDRLCPDHEEIARAEAEGVVGQQLGEALDARVGQHRSSAREWSHDGSTSAQ